MKSGALQKALDTLSQGEVIAFPTETYYGLGADVSNPDAVAAVNALKRRPPGQALPILLPDAAFLGHMIDGLSDQARLLVETFWPGALTLIFQSAPSFNCAAAAPDGSLGLRISNHPLCQELVRKFGAPLTATSANLTAHPPASTAEQVRTAMGKALFVLDGGATTGGMASTVIDTRFLDRGLSHALLRPGAIPAEDIARALNINPADGSYLVGPEETLDTILRGEIRVLQARQGYRFSVDAVLLANFAAQWNAGRVLELGCGCGVISFILLHLQAESEVVGVELQPAMAHRAQRGAVINGLNRRLKVIEGDLREVLKKRLDKAFDLVVSNPPFQIPGSGRISPNAERATARHALSGDLKSLVQAAGRQLDPGGRLVLIYPAERRDYLLQTLLGEQFHPELLQEVIPRQDREANRLMISALFMKKARLETAPPLTLFKREGVYSDEARIILEGS